MGCRSGAKIKGKSKERRPRASDRICVSPMKHTRKPKRHHVKGKKKESQRLDEGGFVMQQVRRKRGTQEVPQKRRWGKR